MHSIGQTMLRRDSAVYALLQHDQRLQCVVDQTGGHIEHTFH